MSDETPLSIGFASDDLIYINGDERGCWRPVTISLTTPGGEAITITAHPMDGVSIPTMSGSVVVLRHHDGEIVTYPATETT